MAVSGDTIVVGAHPTNDSSGHGCRTATRVQQPAEWLAGAAYVFARSGTSWNQEYYLQVPPRNGWHDWFGFSVAVSGDTVVIGADGEDSNATGVNGDQIDDSAGNAGAAYVFLNATVGTNYCIAGPNSTFAPAAISAAGSASVAENDLLLLAQPVPNQPGLFFVRPPASDRPVRKRHAVRRRSRSAGWTSSTWSETSMATLVDNTNPPTHGDADHGGLHLALPGLVP